MGWSVVLAVVAVAFCCVCVGGVAGLHDSREVERNSFMAPINSYDAFGKRFIPNWVYGGQTSLNKNFVRLTPDRDGMRGILWNTAPVNYSDWSVVMRFRVSGSLKWRFGEGMALWYTETRARYPGPVFGGPDRWKGLAVFFDTFRDRGHNYPHPYISAMVNNGEVSYFNDTNYYKTGCQSFFRYHEGRHDFSVKNMTNVRVTYVRETLKVEVDTSSNGKFIDCFSLANVRLGRDGYFGLSAATGERSDNHDVLSLHAYDLTQNPQVPAGEEEEKKDDSAEPDIDVEEVNRIIQNTAVIRTVEDSIEHLQHDLEHQLASVKESLEATIQKLADQEYDAEQKIEQHTRSIERMQSKTDSRVNATLKFVEEQQLTSLKETLESAIRKLTVAESNQERRLKVLEDSFKSEVSVRLDAVERRLHMTITEKADLHLQASTAWFWPMVGIVVTIVALVIFAVIKYRALMKRHLL